MKKIAYLGFPGSYSYIAGKKYFGSEAIMLSQNSFENIFKAVSDGICSHGIVPLENSLTGSILQVYDLLQSTDVQIVGEIFLQINLCLMVKKANTKQPVCCYSHIEAIKQCKSFFRQKKNLQPLYADDTASAAKSLALDKREGASAIASKEAAKIYKLTILKKNLADNPHDYTRFAIIANKKKGKGNKVSIIFSIKHKPGSLVRTLTAYADYGFNLTKIESRPVFGKPWEYLFFVDFEIDGKEEKFLSLVKRMAKQADFVKLIGRYEKGKTYES